MSIVVTGASGHLGGLAIRYLLERQVPANQIIAVVRQPEKASALAELGVQVRQGDFNDRASLEAAFAGAEKLLFVPSPDAHDETLRLLQHANVAKAAKDAHIQQIAYYGYAFAEQSALPLAQTHLITEGILRSTGIPYTFLRNSLYTEVFVSPDIVGAAVQYGAVSGNAGNGQVHTASRKDFAKAGAVVLTEAGHENKTYNLVADTTWTFSELASVIAEAAGKPVAYNAISFADNQQLLQQAGLPEGVALMVSGIYQSVADGETSQTGTDLVGIIGPLTPLKELVEEALPN